MTLANKLSQLAQTLEKAQLWDDTPPSPEQLMSVEPFCVDTLRFEQWLQWIFIPKLNAMVDMPNFSGLPNQSDIHTMATYVFKNYPQDTSNICAVIKQIDDGLNAFSAISIH